jgi:serine palmitoyltransferase
MCPGEFDLLELISNARLEMESFQQHTATTLIVHTVHVLYLYIGQDCYRCFVFLRSPPLDTPQKRRPNTSKEQPQQEEQTLDAMLLPNVYQLGFAVGRALQHLMDNHALPDLPSPREVSNFILRLPLMYKDWWWNLVTNDPVHVAVETTLLASVVYMVLISRNKDYRSSHRSRERLSTKEQEELLEEWKDTRADLAPAKIGGGRRAMVVYAFQGRTMEVQFDDADDDDDTNDKDNTTNNNKENTNNNNKKEDDGRGEKKKPKEPLRKTVLNMATNDFLAMSANAEVKEASKVALSKYGCGSCGPRGFYGTIDVHLQLEQAVAEFTGTQGAIMYSDGASTVTSTLAAFAKRGDLLVVDDGVYEPIVTGVTLSRANVEWFRHNDMVRSASIFIIYLYAYIGAGWCVLFFAPTQANSLMTSKFGILVQQVDLRRVLEKVRKMDKVLGRKPSDQRRFIVVEGLYKNSGTIVPLDELAALKHEFNYRLILDESFSFGSLGPSGKGVLELYQKRHMYDAEIVTISLENALGSIGGVTVGNEEVVDHQRLSGAGYCFSASSPPFTASAAISSLEQLGTKPQLHTSLRENIKLFYGKLKDVDARVIPQTLVCTSDVRSPIVFFELDAADAAQTTYEANVAKLDFIVNYCLENGVAILSTQRRFHRKNIPSPAIRMTLSAAHTEEDLDCVLTVLTNAVLANAKS